MKKIISYVFTLFSFLLAITVFNPGHAFAISCTDGSSDCGIVAQYNFGTIACSMSGSDIVNGNRVLGGQVCSVGGGDVPGFYMNGTNEPNNSTPYFAYSGSTPPGWNYSKTFFSFLSIPTDEWNEDPYHNIRFFGSKASVSLSRPDDDSTFQVGSNIISYSGCNALVTDVAKSGCPSAVFSGNTNPTVNPGDPLVLTVTNRLRPNNGTGTWGGGSANITLGEVTECDTKAFYNTQNVPRAGGYPAVDYHPVAPGVCAPTTPPCTINSFGPSDLVVSPGGNTTLNFSLSSDSGVQTWTIAKIDNSTLNPDPSTPLGSSNSGSSGTGVLSSTQTYKLTCGTGLNAPTAVTTVTVAQPSLSVAGTGTGASGSSVNLTVTKGQQGIIVPFKFWNSGQTGSKIFVDGAACKANPAQAFLSCDSVNLIAN
jgi:hypothetical protein